MMVIMDETNTNVLGVPLANHLRARLTAFAAPANVPGAALLVPLLASAACSVTIKNTGATATNGQSVTVNTTETHGTGDEFVESVIFELVNASNSAGFAALETGLRGGTPIRTYGRGKSDLESTASWTLAQILNAQVGYAPSQFGTGHINACVNIANLQLFQNHFATLPHNAAAAPNTVMALPTPEMYAYNGAVTVAANNIALNAGIAITDNRKVPAKQIQPVKIKRAIGVESLVSTINAAKSARFFWTLVEALRNPPANVAVNWGGGGIASWEFTPAMRALAPDTPDPWQVKIAACVQGATSAIPNKNVYA